MRKSQLVLLVFAGALGLAMLGGCSQDITASYVRGHLTPELQSVAMTKEQRLNMWAETNNTNMRELNDEFDDFFLLNSPSKLSEYPVP